MLSIYMQRIIRKGEKQYYTYKGTTEDGIVFQNKWNTSERKIFKTWTAANKFFDKLKPACFCGIHGIRYISHGEWSDAELVWHGKSFNIFDVQDPLWHEFEEEHPTEDYSNFEIYDKFASWVKQNAYLAREYLQNLMDCKCFY